VFLITVNQLRLQNWWHKVFSHVWSDPPSQRLHKNNIIFTRNFKKVSTLYSQQYTINSSTHMREHTCTHTSSRPLVYLEVEMKLAGEGSNREVTQALWTKCPITGILVDGITSCVLFLLIGRWQGHGYWSREGRGRLGRQRRGGYSLLTFRAVDWRWISSRQTTWDRLRRNATEILQD